MQIVERSAGNVTVLDLSGQITFTQGDQQFKDKVNSLVHQGHKNILVNLATSRTSTVPASASSSAPTRRCRKLAAA